MKHLYYRVSDTVDVWFEHIPKDFFRVADSRKWRCFIFTEHFCNIVVLDVSILIQLMSNPYDRMHLCSECTTKSLTKSICLIFRFEPTVRNPAKYIDSGLHISFHTLYESVLGYKRMPKAS